MNGVDEGVEDAQPIANHAWLGPGLLEISSRRLKKTTTRILVVDSGLESGISMLWIGLTRFPR
jgi:hypothetical protein